MKKRKILIVDDEEAFLNATKLVLEDTQKYEVLTLTCGEEIITHVNQFEPDIILLDILMPKIGGLDICEKLNQDYKGRAIPIIVISALVEQQDQLKAYKKGVVDYLTKPIDHNLLVARIEKAIRGKYNNGS